jgi:hypothetical protein
VGTVLLSSRAPIGYLAIAQIPSAVNQGFIAMVCRKRISNVFQLDQQSVIPFVGAGMSKPTGFPLWEDFLKTLTAAYPSIRCQLDVHLAAFQYEKAAQLLGDTMGPDVFAEAIQNAFGSRLKTLKGPVQLLPFVFTRGCLTTNFDYILNRVYEGSDHRFKDEFGGMWLRDLTGCGIKRRSINPRASASLTQPREQKGRRISVSRVFELQMTRAPHLFAPVFDAVWMALPDSGIAFRQRGVIRYNKRLRLDEQRVLRKVAVLVVDRLDARAIHRQQRARKD